MTKQKHIYIRGMHCASCEKLLNEEFRKIPGVEDVKINRKNDSALLSFAGENLDVEEIQRIAKKFGYEVIESKPSGIKTAVDWAAWVKAFLLFLLILLAYKFFLNSSFGAMLGPGNSTVTYGVSFLIGLVASVSSCLAIVGGVVLAFSEKYEAHSENFYKKTINPNLFFHLGRLGTFFILGGALGALGGEMRISGNSVSYFTFIIAALMAWLGLNILGILPSISALGIKMPSLFTSSWSKLKESEQKADPFLLGALTFFLPCGFTQSMQVFALASGIFLRGGFSLFLFALGTMPVLFIIGVSAAWAKNRGIAIFQKVAGMLILAFAIFSFNSALALRGVSTNVVNGPRNSLKEEQSGGNNYQIQKQSVVDTKKSQEQSAQTVTMNVTASGFEPSVIKIKSGVPVKWVINGESVSGCTSTIIIPSLSISKGLSYGQNLVEFMPTRKGEIPFSCGMGMVRGKFVVE